MCSDRTTTVRFPVAEGIFLILTKSNNFDLDVIVDGESIKITFKMTHTLLSSIVCLTYLLFSTSPFDCLVLHFTV